jgi:hypothetical protein
MLPPPSAPATTCLLHHRLRPPQAASTIRSDYHRSEHHHPPHVHIASPTTLGVAARTRIASPQPLDCSRTRALGLVTKFETALRALVFK